MKAYEVERNRVASSSDAVGNVLQNTTEAFAMLHGLRSCSLYKVKVRAYTSAGPGDFGRLPDDIETTRRLMFFFFPLLLLVLFTKDILLLFVVSGSHQGM